MITLRKLPNNSYQEDSVYCVLPHEAKICCDSFDFDREKMIEVVTWLAQYGETQRVGVKLWFSLYFILCNIDKKPPKAFPHLN